MANSSIGTTAINLCAANFTFDAPFQFILADGEVFYAEKVVRIIPKRRMVVFGEWQGKAVVAKIFFDPRRAKHHYQKEIAGVRLFQDHKIPTPELFYEGVSADKRIYVLLFDRIFDARNLEELWQEKIFLKALMPDLKSVMIELATQHVLGVLQNDLHLKNFLLTEKIVYTLDGAQVELFPKILSKQDSINNLALFLSQLGTGIERAQIELYRHYAKARGWLIKTRDVRELFRKIKHYASLRWQRYEKKIFRECTDFSRIRHFKSNGMYDRKYAGSELTEFLNNPEMAFNHDSAKILKNGRSSTVIKVILDKRQFVIKRYNIKGIFHYLRRCFRDTRAKESWRLAQKLTLARIATAAPVAFIENKLFGLRGKSYYVMEYIPGEHIGEFFTRFQGDAEKIRLLLKRTVMLLKTLTNIGITHGDLKMSNILVNKYVQPLVIDLDGAVEHTSLASLRKSWRKEIKRFLRNFDQQPQLQTQFMKELK